MHLLVLDLLIPHILYKSQQNTKPKTEKNKNEMIISNY